MLVIEPTAWIAQPWRNGAGTTHELVRWPEAGPFAIRISVADITAPAPFSAFAGYRRWLYLLDGGPVTLAIDGRDTVIAIPGDGVEFAGDATVAATTVACASRDLNFMVESPLSVRCEVLRGSSSHELAGGAVAVFVIGGEVTVSADPRRAVLGRHGCAWATDERLGLELSADASVAILVADRTTS
jgi:environmental stress-induced protein Ves